MIDMKDLLFIYHGNLSTHMKDLLFRGKTLCSDEPKCSRDLSFRDFLIDTKIITHKINSNIVLNGQNFGKIRDYKSLRVFCKNYNQL